MTKWFIKKDGRLFGPFNDDQIHQLAESESIDSDTLVRQGADGQWKLARHVAGLSQEFEETDVRIPAMLREKPGDHAPTRQADASAKSPQPSRADVIVSSTDELLRSPENESEPCSTEEPAARQPTKRAPITQPTRVAVPSKDQPVKKAPRSRPPIVEKRQDPPKVVAATKRSDGPNPFVAAMLNCILPGSGHVYVGRKQLGVKLLIAIPFVYVVLWAGGWMLAKESIRAEPAAISATTAEGHFIGDAENDGYAMSLIIIVVLVCFLTPVVLHAYSVIHVVGFSGS